MKRGAFCNMQRFICFNFPKPLYNPVITRVARRKDVDWLAARTRSAHGPIGRFCRRQTPPKSNMKHIFNSSLCQASKTAFRSRAALRAL